MLQIAIGGIMLYFPPGKWLVEQAALGVHKVMSYSDAGSAFIFGSLVGPKMDVLFDGAGFIFAFRVLPAIIFVTALISLLYYIGVMGLLIRILRRYFPESAEHQQDRVVCCGHYHFPRAKRDPGDC
ncbi:nucleoside transporter [Citrobacter koseri]|uniref:Nucleoside transporter n=1 Tax=Citrobacter koseri TaxID=545 RepID=A0A2X2VIF5_CITKO|nr:nucleoside transporter [Citrobacter koseri]